MRLFQQRQLIRFASTGVGSTALHVLIALSLIEWLLVRPTLANILAYSVCTLFSYAVNTRWSFSKSLNPRNFRRFIAVSLLGFMLTMGLAWGAEALGWPPFVGIMMVVCVVTFMSFVLHSRWTYRPH